MSKKSRALLVASLLTSSVLYPSLGVLAADLTEDQQAVYDAVIQQLQLGEGPGVTIGENSATKMDTSVAIGTNANANANSSNTAVGWNATATGIGHSAAYGTNSKALGEGSLAVGPGAEAYGKSGIAIGNTAISNTETLAESSIAIGDRAEAKSSGSIGMGIKSIASGKRSMAMGIQTQATGNYSMAIGGYSNASGADSIALGHNAVAATSSSVAIGAKSVADRGYDTYGYTVDHAAFTSDAELLTYLGKIDEYNATVDIIAANKKDYDEKYAAWRADRGNEELRVVAEEAEAKWVASQQALLKLTAAYKSYFGAASVGTDFATRQITGVAAGSEDTDAVNVAQLKALNTKVDANKIEYVSINSSVEENKGNDGATATDTVAIGPKASATYEGAVAIGRNVTANGGVAIGQNSSSTSEHSVAIGLGSVAGDSLQADVAIGNVAKAAGYSVAIGNGASAFMDSDPEHGGSGLAVAIGSGAVVSGQGGVAVGQGSKAVFQSNAMGSLAKATARGAVAIGDTTEATGVGAVSIGNRAEADNVMGIAIGTYTKGLGYGTIGIGGNAEATGNWSMAMGQSSVASAKLSTALGHYSNVTSEKSVAVGPYASAQNGSFATALGYSASTSAGSAVALGSYSAASGGASMALGYDSAANVNTGVALGAFSVADRGSKVHGYNVDSVGFGADEDIAAYIGKAEAYQTATEDFNAKLAVYNEKKAALADDPDNEQLKTEYEEASKAAEASFDARNAIVSAYRSGLGAISVGTAGDTRQITNVAAGSEDTDAVNVAQLKGLKTLVDTKTESLEDNSKGYFHANIKEATDPTWNNYGLMSETGGAGGLYSVAAGIEAQVNKDAEKAVAIGYRTKTKQTGGIAVGYDTVSDGKHAVAIGQDAVAKGVDATALGFNAQALNAQSLALGNQAKATGAWSIAIAQDTEASGHLSLAASYGAKTAGLQSVGIGVLAATSSAAENSVAIGTMAQALGENTTAIGPTAKVQGSRSVGLGQGATTESTAYNGTAIGRNAYIGSIRDSGGGIGIPSDGISEGDDTTPEVGKEHMNSTALGFAAKAFGFQTLSVGAGAETYDTNTIAIGVNAVAKDHYATALGKQARATGKNSTAIGHWATSVGEDSVSIGTLSTIQGLDGKTAINKSATSGSYSRAAIDNSVALGYESLAYVGDNVATKAYLTDEAFTKENGVVSVGNAEYTIGETTVEANRRRITNVAGGAADYDAVNVAQLQAVEAEGLNFKGDGDTIVHRNLGTELIISGGNTDTTTLTDNNIGVVADKDSGSLSVKLSKNLNLADGSVTFAETAKDADGNPLVKGEDGKWYTDLTDAVYNADSQTYTKDGADLTAVESPIVGAVKLSSTGLDNGNQRITNVAAGVDGTDAVNMSQLTALTNKVDANKIEYVSIKSAETENKLNDGATGDNSIAIGPKTKVTSASAVAIGSQSEISNSNFSSAYGATSKVTGSEQGTAIGYGAIVDNSLFGTALGTRANVTNSLQGTAVGQSAIVSGSNYGTSLGTFSKVINSDSGIAIGSMANVNNANYGMAIGINSSVTIQGGTALGYGTSVTEKSGVALGLGAVANRSAEVYGYSPDGVTFTDDASVAAYLGKTAEFEQANQDYVEKVQIFQEKLVAYQQNPRDPNAIQAYVDAANAMTESFEKRTGIIAAYKPSYGAVSVGGSGATRQIINVAAGTEATDAVNLAQLKTVETIAKAHTELTLDGKSATAGADGKLGDYIGENNLTMAVKDVNGQKVYDLKLKNEVVIGQPGKDGKDGTPGSIGLVGPQGPAGEDGQPGKNAYGEISVKNGVDGVDGTNGKDGMTRIVYVDENDKEHTVATLEDGLKFAGDTENVTIAKKLNETLTVTGGISDASLLTDNNIGVVAQDKGGLTVKLAKNLDLADGSVRIGGTTGEDGAVTGGIYIANQKAVPTTKDGKTEDGLFITGLGNTKWDPATNGIVSGRAATEDQLEKAIAKVSSDVGGAHTELTLDGKSATAGADGKLGDYIGDNNLTMAVKDVNGQKVYDLKLSNEVVIGTPGKDGKDGTPGSIGLVGPQGPAGEDGQPGKNAYGEISVKNGADGVDGTNGKDGMTRIVYVDENDKEHTVATLEDGLKFAGDTKDVTIAKKLNETLEVKGGISDAGLLTDNNIGVVAKSDGGLTVKLAKNIDLADGSVRIGGTTGEDGVVTGGIYIAKQQGIATTKDGVTDDGSFITGLTNTKWDPATNGIVSGRAATEDQLNAAISNVVTSVGGAHTELTLDGKSAEAGADGELGDYIGDNNLTMAVKDVNGQKVYDLKLKNQVVIGQPGKDGKDGKPGSIGLVGPQGPAGEDGQPGKNAYGEISVKNGADGVDGTNGKDGMTRIVYVDENNKEHTVATLEDGLKFAGDTENVTIAKKLNETLEVKGGISDASMLTDNNIGVVAEEKSGLTVKLAKNLNLNDGSIRIGGTTAEDGTLTGGIYIANQKAVPTTKDGKTEDGLFITGLANTDWNPDANGIVENRAATEKQLKAVADSSARVDAANLSDDNVDSWKAKLGITDTLLGEAGAWKLTVNDTGERSIKKDSVINFVNGSNVQITQEDNDIKVGLDSKFVEQVTNNTKNITNLDNRVTKVEGDVTNVKKDITKINNDITNINKDITNINTKIETIEGKAGVANVVGDPETGVKAEKVDANDATKGVKVSLEEKIKVGGITIDGTTPSEGETANRTITGLTNTTWDAEKAVDNRAATEGQLKDFAKSIAGTAGATTINGDDNINAVKVEGKNEYNLSLNDDLKVGNSIAVNNMTYISKDGINANDKEIKNVKAVELTADGTNAATTGQVYTVRQEMATAIGGVATAVQNNARQISKLDSKVNKSGAGAAALAALHPLDYDPDNKWNFTAGMGTYHGSNAVALGAFYRPNENTLFSIGGSMGNGENMMNVGVSMKFGNSNPYAGMSKGRLIEYVEKQTSEIDELKAQNESQNERIQKLEELVQSLMAAR